MTNPLRALGDLGQAVWLDYLHRKFLAAGDLTRLVEAGEVRGVTSNPSIFQSAIGKGDTYDAGLKAILDQGDTDPVDLYERLAVADIQVAADQLRPLWDKLGGQDGYVSLEVSPYLAHDTDGALAEARRLWKAVDRPNLMIKIPGVPEGVPAIRALIAEGINVNVTLLFSVEAYLAVAEAYLAGLEDRKAAGGDLSTVHSVASFFVSRIDGVIDAEIDRRAASTDDPAQSRDLKVLRGKVAIANAKVAYRRYLELIATPRWRALAEAGAAPQRLLWASTGTKDKAYSDVLYVETLIGPDTVNTMPPATMDAFRDHGVAEETLGRDLDGAEAMLAEVERLGLDLPGVTTFLAKDGVEKFSQSFDELLGAVATKRQAMLGDRLNGQTLSAGPLAGALEKATAVAAKEGWSRRLWLKDNSLWTGGDEGQWLGWLDAANGGAVDIPDLEALAADVKAAGFTHVLLLGMGGSSLGPEVLAQTFGAAPGFPTLLVLDSTDPEQVARTAGLIDPARTLFVVASKSGSTLEPDVLHRYFFDLTEKALGAGKAGRQFLAITDPGSKLEALAAEQGFRHVFPGVPSIGGRYSVLSNFGMVPAAVIGKDVAAIFDSLGHMVRACGPGAPPLANPAVELGLLLGVAAIGGRDKVTVVASPAVADIGAWLEQLIAESTGKLCKGLIPVDGEVLGPPEVYGQDRLFAQIRLKEADDADADAALAALEAAGHPVVRIVLASPDGIFQEFFRWEAAVAVAGAVMGIDPFDQPDVEASKIKTRALTDAYEKTGALASAPPLFADADIALYADDANTAALKAATSTLSLEGFLAAHFARAGAGDYLALLAYIDRNPAHIGLLQGLRQKLRNRLHVATIPQFGPRFLHSTGQAYKGGPNSGVFLQITADSGRDLAVPGRKLSFDVIEAAQAQGDLGVLAERGRRHLRVHLTGDTNAALARLAQAVEAALD